MEKRYIVFLKLCLGWLIILMTYLLTYSVPFLIGWNVKHVLGILLIAFPYTAGALYYSVFFKGNSKTFYALGFLAPCIIEKILIYLLSAFIYDINPLYIASVMQKIDEGSLYDVSFFSWGYVFGGLLISIIMTIFLVRSQKSMTD
ncbi:hypothetical protein [Bacillus chungangensis]|uniref:Uncharacterized protein n=1 Tax=Bacillus chungangensis TaxID=587633 RepID=A0ABT9WN89_9BACI|nr:hypothetical protein [Bacillus chungangensis]MDQ0174743.1 hypothetical protein [Bacillus chungangensis]